jgi:HSP20 family protein
VKGDELDIQVTANNIAISGERKIDTEKEGARYHRREREAGKFSRMIGLPGDINSDKVDAKLENGILTIVVSKAEAAKPKQITVKS